MRTKFILLTFILLVTTLNLFSQISEGGKPISFQYNLKADFPIIEMPEFDVNELLKEDSINPLPFRFAKTFSVNYDVKNSGKCETLPNGDKIWRIGFKSSGAYSLNIIFNEYLLPERAKLFLYNELKNDIIGAFTYKNNKDTKILPTMLVKGDVIIIEYYEPFNVEFFGKLNIGQVAHDYKGTFGYQKDGSFGASGSCNIDINCPEGDNWQVEKRSVCRFLMGGAYLCSGALINTTSPTAFSTFLTANHCIPGGAYSTWVFYFNYESPTCNGVDGSTAQTIAGCSFLATHNNLDFCLVEMSSIPPASYHPYYAGWDRAYMPSWTAGIHHPSGDVKKISIDYDAPTIESHGSWLSDTHWEIGAWDVGTTEQGSSGSPLFNSYGEIVGDLTGGDASCGNPTGSDYYQMLFYSWDTYSNYDEQLKFWLDWDDTGAEYISGYDPYPVQIKSITKNSEDIFKIYPNPNNGNFTLEFDEIKQNVIIEISDITGKLIYNKNVDFPFKRKELNISNLKNGVYLINIKTNEISFIKRLLIQK